MSKEPIINRDDLTEMPQAAAPHTGTIRTDLELIHGEPGLDGQPSWVLFDPTSGNYFRISNRHYQIIRMLSGDQPLPEFMRKLREAGVAASEDEVKKVLSFMVQNNLVRPSYLSTAQRVGKMRDFQKGMFWQKVLSSYLFFRIPLWSPDRFLDATKQMVARFFNRWTMLILWGLAIIGFISVIVNAGKLADAFVNSISFQGLIRYGVAVVFIKILHEFSHAYTAKRFGCRVRKMGIAIVFFFPRFYSDLTDAWRINNRRARSLIDAAGILCEILIGGLAALVWVYSRSGTTKEIAYYIFAVSIINTLFINGNPFIRYDGYYILMDLIGIDNLAKRGTELFRSMWQKSLFGITPKSAEPVRGWRRPFLIFYAVGSFVYRIFLYTSIILLVLYQFGKEIGIFLLALEVYLLILKPLITEIKNLWNMREKIHISRTAPAILGLAVIAALFIVPLPWSVNAPAEVRPAENIAVYATEPGFLTEFPVTDGGEVKAGMTVFRQQNPLLEWRIQEAAVDLVRNDVELNQAQVAIETVNRLDMLRQERRNLLAVAGELDHRREMLDFITPIDGVFARYDRRLTAGKWLERGELVGEIFVPGRVRVIGYLPEKEALELRLGETVELMFPDRISTLPGTVTAVNAAGARLTPSPLLNTFGGPIVVYADESGLFIPIEGTYQIEVDIPEEYQSQLAPGRTGTVTYRRSSSLLADFFRSLLSVLRREFNL